ncbi:MAG: aldo/keto reductase [Christensenellaceae bacterium]|jgi:aryl-alcohol dehydrogenase-like predicted oxidoreductase|nr:aldo/keto reductase [Christensenellaceae bacterium]
MQKISLGRTGLETTIAGLGCGGFSRIGIATKGEAHAASIVRAAYDAGVNFFDTATAYGTQGAVGQGLKGLPRESYILSTKFPYKAKTKEELMPTIEESLRLLRTDHIDVYHIHGVSAEDYPYVRDELLPTLKKAQEQGKIRFPGITEAFGPDTTHAMLKIALPEDLFDVVMVGYNLLNPSAAKEVLPLAAENGVGTLCMFAVRTALSNPAQLKADIAEILQNGQADPALLRPDEDLSFLTQGGVASSIMEAAYRFCRHSAGIDVVLTGTGSQAHLLDNLRSIEGPELPDAVLDRLHALFGGVDSVSGQPKAAR